MKKVVPGAVRQSPTKRAAVPGATREPGDFAAPRYNLLNVPVHAPDEGKALPATVRGDMERHLGRELPDVRVHVTGRADQAARELGASAFTVGQDVFFASGKFAPQSPVGRQLLAHELTHVVQQSGSSTVTPGADHEAEADAAAAAPRGTTVLISRSSAFGALQCSPRQRAGHREAVVTVHWHPDDWEFQDRVVTAVMASSGFRGVPVDLLPFALNTRVSILHGNRDFMQGHKVQLRVSADYDPDATVELSNIRVELVETDAKKPAATTGTAVASTSSATSSSSPDQHTWLSDTIGKKVAELDALGYDGYEVTISSGMGTVISHEERLGHAGARPSGIGEISAREAGDNIRSKLDFVESSPGAYTFTFERDARSRAIHLQRWHKDSDYKPARVQPQTTTVATQPLSDEEQLEQAIGMPSPLRVNRALAKLGGKLIHDSNPVNAKNLPYTLAGILIPMGGMKLLMMDTEQLGTLRITWEMGDEAEAATLAEGDVVQTPRGTQKVISVDGKNIVSEPYTPPTETPAAADTPTATETPTTPAKQPIAATNEAAAEAATAAKTPYVAQPKEEIDPTKVDVYRGGNTFELKPGEFRVDKPTKMVKPLRGPSLNTDPANKNIVNNGGAYKITSIPKELKIYQHADTAGTHLEIVPREPMTVERFQQLLRQITVVAR